MDNISMNNPIIDNTGTVTPFIAVVQAQNRINIPFPIVKLFGIEKGDVVEAIIRRVKR